MLPIRAFARAIWTETRLQSVTLSKKVTSSSSLRASPRTWVFTVRQRRMFVVVLFLFRAVVCYTIGDWRRREMRQLDGCGKRCQHHSHAQVSIHHSCSLQLLEPAGARRSYRSSHSQQQGAQWRMVGERNWIPQLSRIEKIIKITNNHDDANRRENLRTMSNRMNQMRQLLFDKLTLLATPGNWDHILKSVGLFSFTGLNG